MLLLLVKIIWFGKKLLTGRRTGGGYNHSLMELLCAVLKGLVIFCKDNKSLVTRSVIIAEGKPTFPLKAVLSS